MSDVNPTPATPGLSDAPWPTAEAHVSIPEPGNPGFRIVGYRVPTELPEVIDSLFDLAKRDREFARLQKIATTATDNPPTLHSMAQHRVGLIEGSDLCEVHIVLRDKAEARAWAVWLGEHHEH